jgi:hypothetical protein
MRLRRWFFAVVLVVAVVAAWAQSLYTFSPPSGTTFFGAVGTPFNQTLTLFSNFPIGATWSSGNPPPGIALSTIAQNGTGLLSGIPTQPGVFGFSVTATPYSLGALSPQVGSSAVANYTMNVFGITTTALPAGSAATPYSFQLSATGGLGSLECERTSAGTHDRFVRCSCRNANGWRQNRYCD